MDTPNNSQNPAEQVVSDLQKDFKIVGSHRVHSWYAWAIVGIVFGMALGIVYVANRSAEFSASQASVMTAPLPPVLNVGFANSGTGTETFDRILESWMAEHDGQTPRQVVIRPGMLITRAGENDDSVQLGEPIVLPFQGPADQMNTRQYIASIRTPYDLSFAKAPAAPGFLISPLGWNGSDFSSMLAENPQTIAGIVTTKNECKCNLAATIGYGGKSTTVTMNDEKVPLSCDANSGGDAFCKEGCVGVAKGASIDYFLGNAPNADAAAVVFYLVALGSGKSGDEAYPPSASDELKNYLDSVGDYMTTASVKFDSLGNRSSCAANKVVK